MKKLSIILALALFGFTLLLAFSQGATGLHGAAGTEAAIESIGLSPAIYTGLKGEAAAVVAALVNGMSALTNFNLMWTIILLALLVELILLYPGVRIQLKQKKIHLFHKKLVDRFQTGEIHTNQAKEELYKLYDVNEKIHSRGAFYFALQALLLLFVFWGINLMVGAPLAFSGTKSILNVSLLDQPKNFLIPLIVGLIYFLHSLTKIYYKEREDYIGSGQTIVAIILAVITSTLVYFVSGIFAAALSLYLATLITFATIRYIVVEQHAKEWGELAQKELIEMLRNARSHHNRFEYLSHKWNHLPVVRYINFNLLEEAISMTLGLILALNFFGMFNAPDDELSARLWNHSPVAMAADYSANMNVTSVQCPASTGYTRNDQFTVHAMGGSGQYNWTFKYLLDSGSLTYLFGSEDKSYNLFGLNYVEATDTLAFTFKNAGNYTLEITEEITEEITDAQSSNKTILCPFTAIEEIQTTPPPSGGGTSPTPPSGSTGAAATIQPNFPKESYRKCEDTPNDPNESAVCNDILDTNALAVLNVWKRMPFENLINIEGGLNFSRYSSAPYTINEADLPPSCCFTFTDPADNENYEFQAIRPTNISPTQLNLDNPDEAAALLLGMVFGQPIACMQGTGQFTCDNFDNKEACQLVGCKWSEIYNSYGQPLLNFCEGTPKFDSISSCNYQISNIPDVALACPAKTTVSTVEDVHFSATNGSGYYKWTITGEEQTSFTVDENGNVSVISGVGQQVVGDGVATYNAPTLTFDDDQTYTVQVEDYYNELNKSSSTCSITAQACPGFYNTNNTLYKEQSVYGGVVYRLNLKNSSGNATVTIDNLDGLNVQRKDGSGYVDLTFTYNQAQLGKSIQININDPASTIDCSSDKLTLTLAGNHPKAKSPKKIFLGL